MKRNFDSMNDIASACASHASDAPRGNTRPSARDPKSRQWCLTLNNYTEAEVASLVSHASKEKYIFAREICPTTGTPHIQGYIKFRQLIRASTLKNWNGRIHWEKCRGGRNEMEIQYNNLIYCRKDRNYIANCYVPKPLMTLTREQLYPWQAALEDELCMDPPPRKVIWIWGEKGNVGKTEFIIYMAHKYDWVQWCAATKSADIITLASPMKCCYLLNFVRRQEGFEPYVAIESLKDGMISDAKLKKECRNILMNKPWVVCFANWPPDIDALSHDRWDIRKVEKGGAVPPLSPP